MKRIALLCLVVLSFLVPWHRSNNEMCHSTCVAASRPKALAMGQNDSDETIAKLRLTLPPGRPASTEEGDTSVRFAPMHIYLDSGNTPLAAYQFELKADPDRVQIVGVEGGEHPAFKEAPYYDPAALANNRIIIAAFNTGTDLPTGRTRIATIHLQITGAAEPGYELILNAAGDPEGNTIDAELSLQRGETQ